MKKQILAVLLAFLCLAAALAGCGKAGKNTVDFSAPGSLSSLRFRYQPDAENFFNHRYELYVLNGEVCLYSQSGLLTQPKLNTPLLVEINAPEKIVDILRRGNAQNWRKEYPVRRLFSRNTVPDYTLSLGFWSEGYDNYSTCGYGGNRPAKFDETSQELLAYLAACAENGAPRPLKGDDNFSSIRLETEAGRLDISFPDSFEDWAGATLRHSPSLTDGAESSYQYSLTAADALILKNLAAIVTEGYNQSLQAWTPDTSPSATIPMAGNFELYLRYNTVDVYIAPKDIQGYTTLPFSFVPTPELNQSLYDLALTLIEGKTPADENT